jgi:predicted phage gp36 major capsid-like protein
LLQDAAFSIENWLFDKVSRGFRDAINAALLLTMSDAIGRPLSQLPQGSPDACSRARRSSSRARCDVNRGSTPTAFGNWKAAYTLVDRRLTNPFSSAGFL